MTQRIFYIVDVFAEEKYSGNQLAVVRQAGDLSDDEMLGITREMNYSETTFILSDAERDGGYDVRIFTPGGELPFAGHPTLGTAYIIQREIVKTPVKSIRLNLKVGQIPVRINLDKDGRKTLWMEQVQPNFGETIEKSVIADMLNLNPDLVDDRFPCQEVSTGMPTLIVPLKTLADLKSVRVNRDRYFELIERLEAKSILAFCPETYDPGRDLNVRVFVEFFGIPEDPATGSGNGSLAAWLVNHRYFGRPDIDIQVEQGTEIHRPSLLFLRAGATGDKINVFVGGHVVMVADGTLV
jgi:trans-2,3-dihydro-3-hydroxyanthranilate isomerase